MQVFNAHFVPKPSHPTDGFEKILVESPYPGDGPVPIGWKVAGDGIYCYSANEQKTQVCTTDGTAALYISSGDIDYLGFLRCLTSS
jgi:hypothetical protein